MRSRPHGLVHGDPRWSRGMTFNTTPDPRAPQPFAGQVLLTQTELDGLVEELALQRTAHRVDLAERMRDARGFGVSGDNDDQLAVLDDAVIDRVRIAQLERLIAAATVVDGTAASHGVAGLGSVVCIEDQTGRQAEYEIVGRRSEGSDRPAGHSGFAHGRGAARRTRRRPGAGVAAERSRARVHRGFSGGLTMIRLGVLDDHPAVLAGFRRLLEPARDIEVLAAAADEVVLARELRGRRIDVLVLDYDPGRGDALALCRRVKARPGGPES